MSHLLFIIAFVTGIQRQNILYATKYVFYGGHLELYVVQLRNRGYTCWPRIIPKHTLMHVLVLSLSDGINVSFCSACTVFSLIVAPGV